MRQTVWLVLSCFFFLEEFGSLAGTALLPIAG